MKKSIFYFLSAVISAVFLVACSNEEESISLNQPRTSLTKEQEADILKMADYVMSDSKQTRSVIIIGDPSKLRKLNDINLECYPGEGTCLPLVVVFPDYSSVGSPNLSDNLSGSIFDKTDAGEYLSKQVTDGNLQLELKRNEDTNTTFRIYSNPDDSDKNMVIPITEQ